MSVSGVEELWATPARARRAPATARTPATDLVHHLVAMNRFLPCSSRRSHLHGRSLTVRGIAQVPGRERGRGYPTRDANGHRACIARFVAREKEEIRDKARPCGRYRYRLFERRNEAGRKVLDGSRANGVRTAAPIAGCTVHATYTPSVGIVQFVPPGRRLGRFPTVSLRGIPAPSAHPLSLWSATAVLPSALQRERDYQRYIGYPSFCALPIKTPPLTTTRREKSDNGR